MDNIKPPLWWCLKGYLFIWVIVRFTKGKMILQLKCYIEVFPSLLWISFKVIWGLCNTVFRAPIQYVWQHRTCLHFGVLKHLCETGILAWISDTQSMHTLLCVQLMLSVLENLTQSFHLRNTVPYYKRGKTVPSLLHAFFLLYLKYLHLIKLNNVKSLISAASQR